MTLPNERTRAVKYAQEFMRSLLDPKQTPRVPKAIRKEAYRVLRHFPNTLDISQAAEKLPNVFAKPECDHEWRILGTKSKAKTRCMLCGARKDAA